MRLNELKRLVFAVFKTPEWNDHEGLKKVWDPLVEESTEELGTVGQARKTIDACRALFSEKQLETKHGLFTEKTHDMLSEIDDVLTRKAFPDHILGHPRDVSHTNIHGTPLGYIIKRHPSGHTLEYFDSLRSGLTVLRYRGVMISAVPHVNLRHESNGRMTVG